VNASGSAKRRWRRLDVCEFDANQLQGGQGWYVTWIAVDPSNPAIVYVAGAAGINSVLRSVNSGGIWTDIHTGLGGTTSPHVDHHGVDFDFNGRLLDGDDGGIYRPPSPPSTVVQIKSLLKTSVPLSWLPATALVGSVG